jgi:hypothetical protein
MGDAGSLLWGVLFGSIGMGYFLYGKRQRRAMALVAGVALCVFPYFVTNSALTVILGALFMALPYFFPL